MSLPGNAAAAELLLVNSEEPERYMKVSLGVERVDIYHPRSDDSHQKIQF